MRPHESNLSHRMLFIGFALTTFNVQNLKKKVGQSLLSVEFPLRRDNYLTVEFGDIWPGVALDSNHCLTISQRCASWNSEQFTLSHYEDER